MKTKPASPVITLLDQVWENANRGTGHSWERLNHSMRNALELAIGAGFEFEIGDIEHVMSHYSSGYWIGESDEWMYGDAVAVGNMSAIKSYEQWKGREPFIAEQVDISVRDVSYLHGGGSRQKERLVVGASFKWQGVPVKVTSFAEDNAHVNCCSYKRVKSKHGNYWSDKIDKRFKITRAELLEGRAFERERKSLVERFRKTENEDLRKTVATKLKVKSWDDFAVVSLEKLRAIIDKHIPAPPRLPRMPAVRITSDQIERVRSSDAYRAGCSTVREAMCDYEPGMKSSSIPKQHREWLIRNCPDVAQELGFIQAAAVA